MRGNIVVIVIAATTALSGCTISVPKWALGDDVKVEVQTTGGVPHAPGKVSADPTVVNLKSDVLFAFGDTRLSGTAREAITRVLKDIPQGAPVQVVGYTDSIGTSAANKKLSTKRAQAVADAVTALRGDLVLEVIGKGESEPIADNTRNGQDDPQGRAKNRRVEIRYDE
ncbi:OmpA family protein [Janibacter sp. G56]|uniref:OmpA family protein n=1 Tax=Janibacter sp. G56 TaxID=3418717 RepID=UPI003CFEAB1B